MYESTDVGKYLPNMSVLKRKLFVGWCESVEPLGIPQKTPEFCRRVWETLQQSIDQSANIEGSQEIL
jgi:hypothetical protein